ncbi:hypothetical protein EV368DRAFT_89492 [Lentinula lateritia]|nr:hypothetical protein EV368DRAFT_89492 [Lentinula lateritia]
MSYRVYMPVILEELGFKVTERWFDEVEEPDFEGDRVVLPSTSSSHSPSSHPSTSSSSTSTSPATQTNTNLSWFARRKANAANAAAHKEAERRRKEERTKAGVQRPPSYASWVGKEGKEKAKVSLDDGELPPREERDTPPLPTRMDSPTPILGSDSRSPTPTPTPTSNTTTTTTTSSATSSATTTIPPPPTSDHTASTLPKTAGFDLAAIKAEVAGLSRGVGVEAVGVEGAENEVGIVPAFEAPRVRVDNKEEPEEIVEPGPLSSSSSSSPPPTPPSKSPDAGYFSFPPTTSMVLTASSYNNNDNDNDNNASSVSLSYNPFATTPTATTASTPSSSTGFTATPTTSTSTSTSTSTPPDPGSATTTTRGLVFGRADGERITPSAGVGLPDPYLPDPWTVPSSTSRRREDVGNPWG